MYQTINKNWLDIFLSELKSAKHVRIISPFINEVMVDHLLKNAQSKTSITVVTRFNLNDFLSGVSSLNALEKLIKAKAKIKGVHGLHSKVYIFDDNSCILTSANFTSGGFFNNHEFGILSHDQKTVDESLQYFRFLESIDHDVLKISQVQLWKQEIANLKLNRPKVPVLKDYGKRSFPLMNQKRNYYIKFFGSGDDRVNLDYSTRDMVSDSHCHFALTFSGRRGRPRKYQDGDVVFIARILHGTDYAILGKAIAYRHVDDRDIASEDDIKAMSWKEKWPIYIRIKDPIFIDATMQECPKMSGLIKDLEYDCFYNTYEYHRDYPDAFINPWQSLSRQADVHLSELGAQWMEMKFDEAIKSEGRLSRTFLKKLYSPIVPGL